MRNVKAIMGASDTYPFLLSTASPTRNQRRFALCVLAVLVGALLVTAPFARIQFSDTEILVPAYASAVLIIELITSVMLLALFSVQNSRAVLVLAIGYLFSGLMVVPWALTFPGAFTAFGLDAGMQATASIAALRRLGFPVFVLAYALLDDRDAQAPRFDNSVRRTILGSVAGVIAAACGLTWLITTSEEILPRFMTNMIVPTDLWRLVPVTAVVLYIAGLVALWRRRRSVLDLWLMVVLFTLLVELMLLSFAGAGIRLNLGWWAGRFYGLVCTSIVLLVLLSETVTLYARLARSILAERRARETRLTTMEAMSASIAHEINQPLASMVTNADAALRWLGRESPDIAEAKAALTYIVSDGHRAGSLIKSIGAMFKKGAQERVATDLNLLIDEVLRRGQGEARFGRVTIETDLDEGLPLVTCNPVQLQQVVSNLVSNAIDAMETVTKRPRILCVTSRLRETGDILVSVADTGTGIDPTHKDRIFDPFFTTKPDGMGMGLMCCLSIVESNGGRLWVSHNVPHGAIFHFTLPSHDDPIA
ncbi:histidine kinase [Skermanella stibiiresistens SB22]|uniref:histidine kinase n=2 Tax=Skermanella TaxID=204447 RepID=W9H3X2_9PROT|nr:histidine kinase [Skermanella stibiiresistens SB22]